MNETSVGFDWKSVWSKSKVLYTIFSVYLPSLIKVQYKCKYIQVVVLYEVFNESIYKKFCNYFLSVVR
jgi:hypothetical protein